LFSIILAAGWPIWPLLACSVLGLALVIERFVSLQQARVVPSRLLDDAIIASRNGVPAPEVVAKLERSSALGQVLAAGFRALGSDARCTEDDLRAAMEAAGRRVAHQLERWLPALATIASAAPLLGLLGTVIGMIEIFGAQTPQGGTNPLVLAHGISIALYNTAFGLVVAIPSMIFYRYFRAKVDALLVDMELQAIKLVEVVHGERKA
jgi:biopolymer transport protein ExbB